MSTSEDHRLSVKHTIEEKHDKINIHTLQNDWKLIQSKNTNTKGPKFETRHNISYK